MKDYEIMSAELAEEVKIFLVEAYENLDSVEQDLVNLEQSPDDLEVINSVFRSIHTIKGNSGFLAFQTLEKLCHRGETLLDKLRNQQMAYNSDIATVLLELVDDTRDILTKVEETGEEGENDIAGTLGRIDGLIG